MENIEHILPITKEDNKKHIKKYKPFIIAVIIFFTISPFVIRYLILLFNEIGITIILISVFIFFASICFIILYVGFISPLRKDNAKGEKLQIIGVVTDKLEKLVKGSVDNTIDYSIVLGGKEKIRIPREEYIKLKVKQKIKVELFKNSKSIISIENLSEKDSSFNYSDINSTEKIDSLSEKEIKYLKKRRNKKIIGIVWFFGFLGYIFYFILKLVIVAIIAIICKILPDVVDPTTISHSFLDGVPFIILVFVVLFTLYFRINKILKDIISKKKRIITVKIDDKIKSDNNYLKLSHPKIKAKINTITIYSIFSITFWEQFFESLSKLINSNRKSTVSTKKHYRYRYLVIDNIYYSVTLENFDKFEINEVVDVHYGNDSNLPVLIQSIDDKNKTIDISATYKK